MLPPIAAGTCSSGYSSIPVQGRLLAPIGDHVKPRRYASYAWAAAPAPLARPHQQAPSGMAWSYWRQLVAAPLAKGTGILVTASGEARR